MIGAASLVLRFALEVTALAALAWWGFGLDAALAVRILAGVAAPAAAAALWGLWVAPKAARRLDDPARLALEGVFWIAGAAAVWAAWRPAAAIVFLAAALATAAAVRVWPEPAAQSRSSTPT